MALAFAVHLALSRMVTIPRGHGGYPVQRPANCKISDGGARRMSENSQPGQLQKRLGLPFAIAVCVGLVVGTGIMRAPGEIAKPGA